MDQGQCELVQTPTGPSSSKSSAYAQPTSLKSSSLGALKKLSGPNPAVRIPHGVPLDRFQTPPNHGNAVPIPRHPTGVTQKREVRFRSPISGNCFLHKIPFSSRNSFFLTKKYFGSRNCFLTKKNFGSRILFFTKRYLLVLEIV